MLPSCQDLLPVTRGVFARGMVFPIRDTTLEGILLGKFKDPTHAHIPFTYNLAVPFCREIIGNIVTIKFYLLMFWRRIRY